MKNNIENFNGQQRDIETPFNKNLIDSNIDQSFFEKLKEFEGDPSKIIRNTSLSELFDRFKNIDNSTVAEVAKRCKELFNELKKDYDIRLPDIEFVIGNSKNEESSLYIITERIKETENKEFHNTEKFITELDDLYYNLACYICDKYKSKEYYLNDIFQNKQYMFGKKEREEGDHIYLVDTDPFVEIESHNCNNPEERLPYYAYMFSKEIVRMENALNEVKFEKARNKFQEFIKLITEDDINKYKQTATQIEGIKKTLNL